MKSNSKIHTKVNDTFDAIESIEDLKVSPFFKEKVMHQIRNASTETEVVSKSWFTPDLQLAILLLFVVFNVLAYTNINSSNYEANIEEFVVTYELESDIETTIFN